MALRSKPLYTSLLHAKQALTNGAPPPMTPLTDRARALFSPRSTFGMGALMEDPERGLKCPFRGCRAYYHHLGNHIGKKHKDVGVIAFKAALGLRRDASLISLKVRNQPISEKVRQHLGQARKMRRRFNGSGGAALSIEELNAREVCHAQLVARLNALGVRLGHVPTRREFRRELGPRNSWIVQSVFGSWDKFLAAAGVGLVLGYSGSRWTVEGALSALVRWYKLRGRFPTSSEAMAAKEARHPPIAGYRMTRVLLGVASWAEVLQKAHDYRLIQVRNARALSRYHENRARPGQWQGSQWKIATP